MHLFPSHGKRHSAALGTESMSMQMPNKSSSNTRTLSSFGQPPKTPARIPRILRYSPPAMSRLSLQILTPPPQNEDDSPERRDLDGSRGGSEVPERRRVFGGRPEFERPNVADHLPEELAEIAGRYGVGLDQRQARRVFAAMVGRGLGSFREIPHFGQQRAEALEEIFGLPKLEVIDRQHSPSDGFAKYLFRLHDGLEVEAVRIPVPCEPPDTREGAELRKKVRGSWKGSRRKYVVCVSSQAGCALGCQFCATATLGFQRHLATWEIVAQVMAVREEADRPIGGVVFMGMGEPFLNYDAVIKAAQIFSHPNGLSIAADNISISTAGIAPAIRRFTAERQRFRLALSLTSAIPEKRRQLMPIERKYPTSELVEALLEYTSSQKKRVTVAWVAIGGPQGNCTHEEAVALGNLLRDVPVRLDLIDVNGEVGGFSPPSEEELSRFRCQLNEELRQPVVRRYSGGKDIDAACGMLAAKKAAEEGKRPA